MNPETWKLIVSVAGLLVAAVTVPIMCGAGAANFEVTPTRYKSLLEVAQNLLEAVLNAQRKAALN